MIQHFQICPYLMLYCSLYCGPALWAGWYAPTFLLSHNNPFVIFGAGVSFFELLRKLRDWHPEGSILSTSLYNFVSGVWLHYAISRPLFMTLPLPLAHLLTCHWKCYMAVGEPDYFMTPSLSFFDGIFVKCCILYECSHVFTFICSSSISTVKVFIALRPFLYED